MVSVNSGNIRELLPEIEHNIEAASFIAIDTEFSGINLGGCSRESRFDQAKHRYERFRQNVQQASLLQLGLACFIRKSNEENDGKMDDSHKVICYNIILAPADTGLKQFESKPLMAEWGAMRFLRRNGLDLNEIIANGVPYLPVSKIQQLVKKLRNGIGMLNSDEFVRETHRTAEQEVQKLRDLIEEGLFAKEPKQFHNLKSNSLALHYKLRDLFPQIWTIPLSWNSIEIRYVNAKQRSLYERNDRSLEEWTLREATVGGRIFTHLIKTKKILVGFQLLQDLMFLISTFYTDLPENYDDFKMLLRELFPNVYDGKVITNTLSREERINLRNHFEAPSLSECFQMLTSPGTTGAFRHVPPIIHDVRHTFYETESHAHEAAYDAYMAGAVILYCVFAIKADEIAVCHFNDLENRVKAPIRPSSAFQKRLHSFHNPDFPQLKFQQISLDLGAVKRFQGLLHLHMAADSTLNIHGMDEQANRSKSWVRLTSVISDVPITKSELLMAFLETCAYEYKVISPDEIIIACPHPDRAANVVRNAEKNFNVKAEIFDSAEERKMSYKIENQIGFLLGTTVLIASTMMLQRFVV